MSEKFAHGGNIYAAPSPVGKWLDFSANINPLGLPDSVRRVLYESIDAVIHYPDPAARELKTAIAEHYHVPFRSIVLGNGAAELFYLFFRQNNFRNALIIAPTFSEYERAALAAGTAVTYGVLDSAQNFAPDFDRLWGQGKNAEVFVLANPNNPTGNLSAANELRRFLAKADAGGKWVLLDESFLDFLPDGAKLSVRDLVGTHKRLFVVRSLTKFFALPGLRLGFALADDELARRLEAGKDVWNVNALAQAAGVAALRDLAYQKKSREFLAREKIFFAAALGENPGWRIFPPAANFVLADVSGTGKSGDEWREILKNRGILIRAFNNFPGLNNNYIRLAVRTRTENEKLLRAIKEV